MGFELTGTPSSVNKVAANADDVMPATAEQVPAQKIAAMAVPSPEPEEKEEDA